MLKKMFLLAIICITAMAIYAQPQGKDELQKKETDLRKEIADLTESLKKLRGDKEINVSKVLAVQRKIAAREELIRTINKKVRLLEEDIYLNELEVYRMKKELDTLKSKYAQSIVFAYKNRSTYQYINFLFSATNFNDALKRMAYLKSYRKQRQVQVETILKTQQVLQQKIGTLAASKQEQSKTLQSHKTELQDLEEDKKAKDQVVKQIKSQEKEISAQLKKKNRQREDIRNAIAVIIKKERDQAIAKRKEERLAKLKADEERKKAATAGTKTSSNTDAKTSAKSGSSTTPGGVTKVDRTSTASDHVLESTPEDKRMSLNFATNKGRLPWPVAGRIMIPFGTYNIGGLVNNSDGVEIAIPQGTPVKSVADGVVEAIFDAGGEQTVMIRHGKYFTTYSYLASVSVSKGQEVNAGSVIGKAGTNDEGEGWLSFMITNEKSVFLNPQSWLK